MYKEIIGLLKENWAKNVNAGWMTIDEMVESVTRTIARCSLGCDECDELTKDYANILGWDYNNITTVQWYEWTSIVNAACIQFLYENIKLWYDENSENIKNIGIEDPDIREIEVTRRIFDTMIRTASENYQGIYETANNWNCVTDN